jgi:peptidoglycan/xylan/chitin deacetylase (PgdA/CDA1 family)
MTLPEGERRKQVEDLERKYGYQMPRESLSVEEVKQLSRLPEVTLGCHTMNHVIGPNCSDSELLSEISGGKRLLEDWTGEKIRFFAYPHGRFDGREKPILESFGIELAFTLEHSLIFRGQDLHYLPRFAAMDRGFLAENICHMTGLWNQWIDRLKRSEGKEKSR